MSDEQPIDKLIDLPLSAKLGALAVLLCVVFGGYWLLVHQSLDEQYVELNTSVDSLKREVAEKTGMVKNLARFEAEVARLDIELNKALKELPNKEEIAMLLSKVSDKARDAGLEIKLFKPGEEKKKDFYAEVPVAVELDGTFHQVATFFDEVGHLERLVNLTDFSLIDPVKDGDKMYVKTTVMATTFRFLDESERPSEQPESKDKKRRGKGSKGKKKNPDEEI